MKNIQFIQVTPEQQQEAILKGVRAELEKLKKEFQPKHPPTYLTRQEVAEMLKVDVSTVHNWSVSGILKRHAIGRRVYYKLSEVERAIIEI
ncbi:DNA-binding protein [Psychroflexus sp. S27]|uniref:helix-turn-helix domain-containing protein n=1 Tax=Psychroflexus sp. S27 TaxID=1982757 RepID=UPI000C2A637C|nr:helix-turn-helix domain-containing protein [Psychroflexus sp. S27]PJX21724.1 DNA-binding protein [Psychroflexus sp. S27]